MANLETRTNELKGTETEKNLMAAFAGESEARNKYTYFASKAKKDGYVQIGQIFEATAANEKEHAKLWYKILSGIGTTVDNLNAAADGEAYEWKEMYPSFAAKEIDLKANPSSLMSELYSVLTSPLFISQIFIVPFSSAAIISLLLFPIATEFT